MGVTCHLTASLRLYTAAKVRRLYDIANVLTSLGLIKKIFNMRDRKPAFQWLHKVQPPFLGGVLPPRPVSPLPQDVQASLAASASGTAGASSTGASTGSDGSKLLTIGRYGKLDRKAVRRKPVPRGVRAAATAAAAAANAMGAVVAVLTPSQGKASSATDYILYQNAVEAQRKQHLLLKEANAQLIAAQSGAVLKQNSDGDTAYGFETIRTSGFPGTSSLIVVGPAASGLAPSASSGSLPRSGSLSFAFNGQNSSENGSSSNIARAGRGRKRSRTVAVVAAAGNRGQVDHPAEATAELVGVGTVDPFSVASTNMATSPSKPSAAPPQPLVGMVLHRNGDCDCVGVCGLPLDQHGVNAPPQMVMIPSAGVTAAVAQVSSMPASEASLLAPAASVSAIVKLCVPSNPTKSKNSFCCLRSPRNAGPSSTTETGQTTRPSERINLKRRAVPSPYNGSFSKTSRTAHVSTTQAIMPRIVAVYSAARSSRIQSKVLRP